MADDRGFFSRWSQRKAQARGVPAAPATAEVPPAVPWPSAAEAKVPQAPALAPSPAPALSSAPTLAAGAAAPAGLTGRAQGAATDATDASDGQDSTPIQPASAAAGAAPPPPTLADAQALAPGDEVSRFVGRGVATEVRNTALKRLFSDPHFNVMDGLDTYIDDYGQPDPLPAGMLRQMAQSQFLRLFDDEPGAAGAEGGTAGVADVAHAAPPAEADGAVAGGDPALVATAAPAADPSLGADPTGTNHAPSASTVPVAAASPEPEPNRPA